MTAVDVFTEMNDRWVVVFLLMEGNGFYYCNLLETWIHGMVLQGARFVHNYMFLNS